MEIYNSIVERLLKRTDGVLVMTPAQLEKEIGVSEKQQSKLRKEDRFPIPHGQVGRKVTYSVHKVAEFLMEDGVHKPKSSKAIKYEAEENLNISKASAKKIIKSKSEIHDMTYLARRAFVTNLIEEGRSLLQLGEQLNVFYEKSEFKRKLEEELSK